MKRLATVCASAVLACATAGCGTMCNMNGGYLIGPPLDGYPAPYGGVARSAEHLQENGVKAPLVSLFWLADMPLTVVGDTVTLPWVLMHREDERGGTRSLPRGIVPAPSSPQSADSAGHPVSPAP
jgi:uncharacterized protein YceK